jgi:hypothetical protein
LNPDLPPETSRQIDLAARWDIRRLRLKKHAWKSVPFARLRLI